MADAQEQPVDKRSASEKIADLERGVMAAFQTMDNMTRDIMTIKEAIKLLGNKVDSIVKASERGLGLNDDILSKIMVENNAAELKDKVTALVGQGILSPQESVDDGSFLVGCELDKDSLEVVNPRLQFTLQALAEPMRDKIRGSKVGNVITFEEDKLKFKVLEIYGINAPKSEESAAPAVDASAAVPVDSTTSTTNA